MLPELLFLTGLAVQECQPNPDPLVPTSCITRREPMTLPECVEAIRQFKITNSAEQLSIDLGVKKGYTYTAVCESEVYQWTVPSQ